MKCPHCGEEIVFKHKPDGTDRAIEMYYRSRAAGNKRFTLNDVAELTGYGVQYLRKCKVVYDRAGKWGAKHKAKP